MAIEGTKWVSGRYAIGLVVQAPTQSQKYQSCGHKKVLISHNCCLKFQGAVGGFFLGAQKLRVKADREHEDRLGQRLAKKARTGKLSVARR